MAELEIKKDADGRSRGNLTEDLRERLEEMRDALLADQPDAARKMIPIVEAAHRKCREHFLP